MRGRGGGRGFGGPRGGFGRGMRGMGRGMRGGGMRGFGRRGFMRPGFRWMGGGMYGLITLAGMGVAMRLHRDDLTRIEEAQGKSVSEMSEEELIQTMKELGIQAEPKTTEEDLEAIEKLAELLYKGFITQEDYDAKKKDILGL